MNVLGMLRISRSQKEELILSASLAPSGFRLLEVATDSKFLLQRCVLTDKLRRTTVFQAAMTLCAKNGDECRRQIKITCHVVPNAVQNDYSSGPQRKLSHSSTKRTPSFKDRFTTDSFPKKSTMLLNDSMRNEQVPAQHSVIEVIPLHQNKEVHRAQDTFEIKSYIDSYKRPAGRRPFHERQRCPDVPYARVKDDLSPQRDSEPEENIYAEICENPQKIMQPGDCSTIQLQKDVGTYYRAVPELEITSSSASSSPEDTLESSSSGNSSNGPSNRPTRHSLHIMNSNSPDRFARPYRYSHSSYDIAHALSRLKPT